MATVVSDWRSQAAAFVRLLLLSAIATPHAPLGAEEIRPLPWVGGDGVYTDVTAQGQILRIDYVEKTARELGTVDLGDRILWQAWLTPDGRSGLFLFSEPSSKPGDYGRIYAYSESPPELEKSSLVLNLNGDNSVLVVTEKLAYIQFSDLEERGFKRVAFDPSNNTFVGSFAFPISGGSIHRLDATGELWLADVLSDRIRIIDTGRNKVLREIDARALVDAGPGEAVFVKALGERHALVTKKYVAEERTRLYLLDSRSWKVVAESEALDFFTGRFSLGGPFETRVFCVEEGIRRSRRAPNGILRTFDLSGGRLVAAPPASFDPDTEIALLGGGGFSVHPLYSFDYLSALTLGREMFWRLEKRLKSPELLRETRARILSEFENSAGDGGGRVQLQRLP